MYPAVPRVSELSRPSLKLLTIWIRDEIDPLVAREGPDILHANDIAILHEVLVALQEVRLTIFDLRATGIHKAIQEIAGVATRWPDRICDDCDKILTKWTVQFGSLKNIRPFLFGRGGRLEGVAGATDWSREALLTRWAAQSPNTVLLRRSHRLGDLKFRPGAWWINPLFAYHAGIIGVESIEGGTTFDKHGAYAVLINDTGDIEGRSINSITYRCPPNDKGRFRLTSATIRSREPIRILLCHSINSIWGPKAGVRYEGLFFVKGWSIRTAKSRDIIDGNDTAGRIIYQVRFERAVSAATDDIAKHPTAAELDDYTEYKRLQKAIKGELHIGSVAPSIRAEPHQSMKAPTNTPMDIPRQSEVAGSLPDTPSSVHTCTSMFRRLYFDEPSKKPPTATIEVMSPTTTTDIDHFNPTITKRSKSPSSKQLDMKDSHTTNISNSSQSSYTTSPEQSNLSSKLTSANIHNIQEVAPWTEYDPGLDMPWLGEAPIITHHRLTARNSSKTVDVSGNSVKSKGRSVKSSPQPGVKDGSYKLTSVKRKKTTTKSSDGVKECAQTLDTSRIVQSANVSPKPATDRQASFDGQVEDLCTIPAQFHMRTASRSRIDLARRDDTSPRMQVAFSDTEPSMASQECDCHHDDPFFDFTTTYLHPLSTPKSSVQQVVGASPRTSRYKAYSGYFHRQVCPYIKAKDVTVDFRNPFGSTEGPRMRDEGESGGVAPEVLE